MTDMQAHGNTSEAIPFVHSRYPGTGLPKEPSPRGDFSTLGALSTLLGFPEPLERTDAETNRPFLIRQLATNRGKDSTKLRLLQRIRELRLYGANWDGMGARVPLEQTVEDAETFLRGLNIEEIEAPHIALAADGEVNFFWETERITLDLGFFGDGTYSYFARAASGKKFYGDNLRIESPLDQEIFALLSRSQENAIHA